jgi:glutamate synthase (NADPH/NADH) small chain
MADPKGFLIFGRSGPRRRPIDLRIHDWQEVYEPFARSDLRQQAARCMDCGIPFCHEGCPLGNLIPEWNDLVMRGRMGEAADALHATNNFPEFTGRLCPAPCEGSCVLGINADPVSIKQVELEIAEWAAKGGDAGGGPRPVPARRKSGKRVAVVGSGPAGLAAAQQLARAGHSVVVFERAERAGGLLRYGIPEFKMEKAVLDRRLAQLVAEGVEFRVATAVGDAVSEVPGAAAPEVTVLPADHIARDFDAVVLAGGATVPRDLPVPGRELAGVHSAMEYLKLSNLACEGSIDATPISARGRHVVIIGGGDTGADCLGTVHRQGPASVHQLEIMVEPPPVRAADNPWPTWPLILRTSSAHEEGGDRVFSVTTTSLRRDEAGQVRSLVCQTVTQQIVDGRPSFVPVPGSEREMAAEMVLLAMGFTGCERRGVVGELGLEIDARGNVARDHNFMTSRDGVFVCGDMGRGQSLIVWAIAEGRSAAAAVDAFLRGQNQSDLPSPITPVQLALR